LSGREKTSVNKGDLNNFWLKTIQNYYGVHCGIVEKISDNSKFGFIKSGNNLYFFRTSNVVNGRIRNNDKVNFTLVKS